jgi:hypothetical protein
MADLANVVRVSLYAPSEEVASEKIAVLSFEVDDMTGEEIATAAERLRQAPGVRDASLLTLVGKKGRPAIGFRLLVEPEAVERVGRLCLAETSTLGLRIREERRLVLPRSFETVRAEGVDWPVKTVRRPDGAMTAKVESDALGEVAGLAQRRHVARLAEAGRSRKSGDD